MCDDMARIRKQHFAENWLVWSALHHFLPAPLIRELAAIIVDQMSNGTLSLEQLFDETITNGPSCFDCWLLYPIKQSSPLAQYLQMRIRGIAWQSDPGSFSSSEGTTVPGTISPLMLEKAIELGSADFMVADWVFDNCSTGAQASFDKFIEAFKIAQKSFTSTEAADFATEIAISIAPVDMPLDSIILKHLGDLCADTDEWDKALALYESAEKKLQGLPAWEMLSKSLRTIITQSKASALRTIAGADKAAAVLHHALEGATVKDRPLLFSNASFDAFVATCKASTKGIPEDTRSVVMLPPLLHNTHDIESALEAWLASKFDDAGRRFWAVLRRQIALGSASEVRSTKALYARTIFDEINHKFRQSTPTSFRMALRLLLESGDPNSATRIAWEEHLVDTYVDQECVEHVITHSQVYSGSKIERQLVAIEVFRGWCESINLDHIDVATIMLKHISMLALESPTTIYAEENIGGRSLEALKSIAEKRPELRHGVVKEVAFMLSKKIGTPAWWKDYQLALDTASVFLDVMPEDSLRLVITSTLSLLDNIKPEAGMWTVVRPALILLSSPNVRRFVREKSPEIERNIIETILRFGLEQESEHTNLLFYLHNFNSALLEDIQMQERLRDVVQHVRNSAVRINSSNVVDNIRALLFSSVVSGIGGVEDALRGLTLILRSVREKQLSLGLLDAYEPLLILAHHQKQIARDISVSPEEFRTFMLPLIDLIVDLWSVAKDQPSIFAPFSIPPTTQPDPIIIHNWAFASMRFAESIERNDKVQEALVAAEIQPVLRDAIALARATRSAASVDSKVDIQSVRNDGRDAFYSTLGRRLAVLQRLNGNEATDLCKALLDQCLRFGPRYIDVAVFLSANSYGLAKNINLASYSEYAKRVEKDRDLRLALAPILDIFKSSIEEKEADDK